MVKLDGDLGFYRIIVDGAVRFVLNPFQRMYRDVFGSEVKWADTWTTYFDSCFENTQEQRNEYREYIRKRMQGGTEQTGENGNAPRSFALIGGLSD